MLRIYRHTLSPYTSPPHATAQLLSPSVCVGLPPPSVGHGTQVSNFTEVTTLLKAKGIDLDNNRFLILQGEVEQISMMAPKAHGPHDEGLLEYLEDIIGSDKYVLVYPLISNRVATP